MVRRDTLNKLLNDSHVRPERRLISRTAWAVDWLGAARFSFTGPDEVPRTGAARPGPTDVLGSNNVYNLMTMTFSAVSVIGAIASYLYRVIEVEVVGFGPTTPTAVVMAVLRRTVGILP